MKSLDILLSETYTTKMKINNIKIGDKYEPYIIAEVSANHNGKIENAISLIDMAKKAGASAVKLQSYTPDTITLDSSNEDFIIEGGYGMESAYMICTVRTISHGNGINHYLIMHQT